MRKKDRHRLITRLLNEIDIRKQEEFVEILKNKGISVTQATISRDRAGAGGQGTRRSQGRKS